ncbi:MAG: GIY-YIG nuclease family protein [Lysobacter sp.]|nr:GIY-YIG nuclease family protein [Lysobacter sp.]
MCCGLRWRWSVGAEIEPCAPHGRHAALSIVIPANAGIQSAAVVPKAPAVYLLASAKRGTLYIGVTSNLVQRVWQHRSHATDGFSERYGVSRLVWFETHETMESAIVREKQLKKWRRDWKLELIEGGNPEWRDLWEDIATTG